MSQHAEKIAQNLYAISAEKMKPLVVVIDGNNNYVTHFGNLRNYQLPDYLDGHSCIEELPFLVGLEEEPYVVLPLISLSNEMVASVNIIQINQNRFVIMLDAAQEHHRQQETTQVSNETKLLNVKLRQLSEQLKQANNVKSRFISGMSHEFRTPISSILGYSKLLADQYSEKDNKYRYSRAIERNANYLLSLIDNVLEHAQLETDKITLNIAPFKIDELLDDIRVMFSAQAKELNLEFYVKAKNELPKLVESDRVRLQQILINIVGNAFKYTKNGSIKVSVDWIDNKLIVVVEDTGPGISIEHQNTIFQAFNRVHAGHKKGAGLGLSISKQLAEKLGGNLELQSHVGVGSVFTITIQAEQTDAITATRIKEFTTKRDIKVLVVEDDKDLVELLKIYLDEFGYSSSVAYDGSDALRQCKQGSFDLMLLDMQLPKLNGDEVAKQLSESGIKIPTIGMTASTNQEDKVNALAAGCNEFLTKPIQVTPLFNTINKLLAKNV